MTVLNHKIIKKVKTFKELCNIISVIDCEKEKGDMFEEIVYYMFKLLPDQSTNIDQIWLYKDIPQSVITTLDLPPIDSGIDILIKKKDGFYIPVQCKFRTEEKTVISHGELGTFFGSSLYIKDFLKEVILVTNCCQPCKLIAKVKHILFIGNDYLSEHLTKSFFKNVAKSLKGNYDRIRYSIKKPMQHQDECINACTLHYSLNSNEPLTINEDETKDAFEERINNVGKNSKRGHIILACGTGKSICSYWIDQKLNNKLTLVLVPSLHLLSQFYSDWIKQSHAEKIEIKYLLVGSDADVEDEIGMNINSGILLDGSQSIRKHIDENNSCKIVIISTYQSSLKVAKAINKEFNIDFVIFDEAHKTVGQPGTQFSLLLTDEHVTIDKRLFMTASPRIYQGSNNENVLCMNNKEQYGERIYTYTTGQAIDDKKLCEYQLVTMTCVSDDIKEMIKMNNLVKYETEFIDKESSYLATILMLLKKINDGSSNHMITYHNSLKRANKFTKFLKVINKLLYPGSNICINSIDGMMTINKRKKIINEFCTTSKSILCTCRVFNEGVNLPIIDSMCFVDARKSTIDIIQCIGRSLRLFDTKKMASIYVPIIIDDIDDEKMNYRSIFKNIIVILKAMRTSDKSIDDYFRLKMNGQKHRRNLLVNEMFTTLNYSKEINLQKWMDAIHTTIWSMTNTIECTLTLVNGWIETNKKRPSKLKGTEEEIKFGLWLSRKIVNYNAKRGSMAIEKNRILFEEFLKKHKLMGLLLTREEKWEKYYDEQIEWYNNNPKKKLSVDVESENTKINWYTNQKAAYNNNKMPEEKREQFKKLIDITEKVYQHIIVPSSSKSWQPSYETLVNWFKNNCGVRPRLNNKNQEENQIAIWFHRNLSKFKINGLSEERQKLIGELVKKYEICLDVNEENHQKQITEMLNWIKENNGKRPSKHSKNKDEKKLGEWLCNQSQNFKYKVHSMSTKEARNQWTILKQQYPILMDDDETWYYMVNETKNWYEQQITAGIKNLKRPARTTNAERKNEKKLAEWLSEQNGGFNTYNEKKTGSFATFPERIKIWNDLRFEYNIVFKKRKKVIK